MTTERRKVLDMLAKGKISTDEAEELIEALEQPSKDFLATEPERNIDDSQ